MSTLILFRQANLGLSLHYENEGLLLSPCHYYFLSEFCISYCFIVSGNYCIVRHSLQCTFIQNWDVQSGKHIGHRQNHYIHIFSKTVDHAHWGVYYIMLCTPHSVLGSVTMKMRLKFEYCETGKKQLGIRLGRGHWRKKGGVPEVIRVLCNSEQSGSAYSSLTCLCWGTWWKFRCFGASWQSTWFFQPWRMVGRILMWFSGFCPLVDMPCVVISPECGQD